MIKEVLKTLEQHKNGEMQSPTAMGQIFALFGVSSRFLIMKQERGKEVFTGLDYGTNTDAENRIAEFERPDYYYVVKEEF